MQVAGNIYPGYLIVSQGDFRAGRGLIRKGDVLRCVSSEKIQKTFVNRRSGTGYTLGIEQLPGNFRAIGFDGLEEIVLL